MNWRGAIGSYHWQFLAEPTGCRNGSSAVIPCSTCMTRSTNWRIPESLRISTREALAEYERCFSNPETIRACCEDYRAGVTSITRSTGPIMATRRSTCRMLAIWGDRGNPGGSDRLVAWREWAEDVRGGAIACGHLPEEAPGETAARLRAFFRGEARSTFRIHAHRTVANHERLPQTVVSWCREAA